MKVGFYLMVGFFVSAAAFAESQDRIPMIEGEKELFEMKDMKAGQCAVSFTDTETGWSPMVNLEPVTKHSALNFRGGNYLLNWNNTFSDKEFIVSVEYFKGDAGRKILKTDVYLDYGKKFDRSDIKKTSREIVFIDASDRLFDFKEKLQIERPGAYKNVDLVSVSQQVQINGKSVSFSRVVNDVHIDLSCDLTD